MILISCTTRCKENSALELESNKVCIIVRSCSFLKLGLMELLAQKKLKKLSAIIYCAAESAKKLFARKTQ